MASRQLGPYPPADETSRTKHPNAPGRLVLQDLPSVIDRIDQLDVSIERMKHDFYAEQPLKGTYGEKLLGPGTLTRPQRGSRVLHALRAARLA